MECWHAKRLFMGVIEQIDTVVPSLLLEKKILSPTDTLEAVALMLVVEWNETDFD